MPAVSGGASGGGLTAIDRHAHDTPLANPVVIATTGQSTTAGVAKSDHESGGTGTDWNAVFAGAAASALIIAMCAGGLSLVRRPRWLPDSHVRRTNEGPASDETGPSACVRYEELPTTVVSGAGTIRM